MVIVSSDDEAGKVSLGSSGARDSKARMRSLTSPRRARKKPRVSESSGSRSSCKRDSGVDEVKECLEFSMSDYKVD